MFLLGAIVGRSSSDHCTGLAGCRCEPNNPVDSGKNVNIILKSSQYLILWNFQQW